MITGRSSDGMFRQYGTVRDWLEDARVVSFTPSIDDAVVDVVEACDRYFHCTLTHDQLLMLADELRAMVPRPRATAAYLEWLKAGAPVTLPDGTKGRMTRDEMLSMAYQLWAYAGTIE